MYRAKGLVLIFSLVAGGQIKLRQINAPAVFPSSFWVQAGGVASYGVDNYAEAVQAARLVAKILRGARPADLPVETVNKIELAINVRRSRPLA